jgi:hypothetical protein
MQTLQRKSNDGAKPERPMSIVELLRSPGVAMVLLPYAIIMIIGQGYTAGRFILHHVALILPLNNCNTKGTDGANDDAL